MHDLDPAKVEIRAAPGKWVIYALGGIFGETTRALQLFRPGRDPVLYVPREDVAMAFLDPTETDAQDARIGRATFYSLDTKSRLLADAAWSYEDPLPEAERLRGYLAFDTGQVTVEKQ